MVSYTNRTEWSDKCYCGLNPCCSGQWSRTISVGKNGAVNHVLILVVVDNGLVHDAAPVIELGNNVLILVVVDNGLVQGRWQFDTPPSEQS